MSGASDRIVIAELRKGRRETLVIALEKFNGHDLVDVRCWVPGDDDQPIPTKKGLSVAVELLPELVNALTKAERLARDRGLLTEAVAA